MQTQKQRETPAMAAYSRLVLNSLYARDPAWLWLPELEVEAVQVQDLVYVRSRTRPGLVHVVNLWQGTCSCEAAQNGRRCWHLEAVEFAVARDETPTWAWGLAAKLGVFRLH